MQEDQVASLAEVMSSLDKVREGGEEDDGRGGGLQKEREREGKGRRRSKKEEERKQKEVVTVTSDQPGNHYQDRLVYQLVVG